MKRGDTPAMVAVAAALLVLLIGAAHAGMVEVIVVELGGDGWTVSNVTSKYAASVPGCIHTDLLAAEAIPDPYYRFNDQELLWVGNSDWTYRRTFDVPCVTARHFRFKKTIFFQKNCAQLTTHAHTHPLQPNVHAAWTCCSERDA